MASCNSKPKTLNPTTPKKKWDPEQVDAAAAKEEAVDMSEVFMKATMQAFSLSLTHTLSQRTREFQEWIRCMRTLSESSQPQALLAEGWLKST